ncbi:protein trichome birefringence-like 19 [Selaginella moellendorffii]|uniref:protein trichome birefringence-like 19 n=1 Tax=Selaginella moellendorffii TaxID=88036 RepID=UPI000D1D09D6|nr:protein trichome birefringence-like 19 [Selaginella moellendorffii]|eukprot:XP_002963663.2 protein trichome birefringence-like 19 [Selaginella moellendorffii]
MRAKRSVPTLLSRFTGLIVFICPAWFITYKSLLWDPTTKHEECDLSHGKWIRDPTGRPLYTNGTCEFIQPAQNCEKNGRPDNEYLKWRWKPDSCELPHFDPSLYLSLVRGKKLLFLGDSLARNHHQSLLCSLSQVETPRELYARGRKDIKLEFPSHGFVLAILWSPLLVQHRRTSQAFEIHLDTPEAVWASEVSSYDIVVISAGQWFFRPSIYYVKNTTVGRNEQLPHSSLPDVKFTYGLKMAFASALEYVLHSAGFSGLLILRTEAMSHYEHGQWNSGGTCNKTKPTANQSSEVTWTPSEMRRLQLEASREVLTRKSRAKFRIIDITRSMFLRPDGHPGRYRGQEDLVVHDCLHWCLPGPIDMWNQMLLHVLQEEVSQKL